MYLDFLFKLYINRIYLYILFTVLFYIYEGFTHIYLLDDGYPDGYADYGDSSSTNGEGSRHDHAWANRPVKVYKAYDPNYVETSQGWRTELPTEFNKKKCYRVRFTFSYL